MFWRINRPSILGLQDSSPSELPEAVVQLGVSSMQPYTVGRGQEMTAQTTKKQFKCIRSIQKFFSSSCFRVMYTKMKTHDCHN